MQDGSTSTMAYGLAHIVFCLSQFMSLNPSDVILTGPPPGIGMGQKPQQYLRPGYIVELGIDGLGQQRQDVIADPE
jgi:2-keto-4-pentenoate hydratase/2-oxohepta-3-ene-1,7-dioic acid hydratase in catechol pathway